MAGRDYTGLEDVMVYAAGFPCQPQLASIYFEAYYVPRSPPTSLHSVRFSRLRRESKFWQEPAAQCFNDCLEAIERTELL